MKKSDKKEIQKIANQVLSLPNNVTVDYSKLNSNNLGVTTSNGGTTIQINPAPIDWSVDPWGDGWNPNPWYGGKDMNQLWPLLNGDADIDVEEATRELIELIKDYPDLVTNLLHKLSQLKAKQEVDAFLEADDD